jgi:hypothetical protein
MRYKGLCCLFFFSSQALAFVHISQLKPRLPVSPESPSMIFYWNGDSPRLTEKDEVLDGVFAGASDFDLMEALLQAAVNQWNNVPTAYIELDIGFDDTAKLDADDEKFSIVVEEQDSQAVAAAALPSFTSDDPEASAAERDPEIIHDCDITVSNSSVSAKALYRTLVHELGHCLGLGHPHSSYRSIMSYSTLDDSAELALDDKAGVSFLYPEPGESAKVDYLTTCGGVGGQSAPGFLLGWFLLPALLVVCRRCSW